MERTFDLVERYGVELEMRPVLPMVMRGLGVSSAKRLYIVLDTKREAESLGLPFGRVADPVGEPVERGYSLYAYACRHGREKEFMLSFTRAAFADGIDTGDDAGLRSVVERAGLDWDEARRELGNEDWQPGFEQNRQAMRGCGLWGVPSYRLRGPEGHPDFPIWGQDRLWLIEERIRERLS
jgi:2-hydroxychromene-2-carboxylate isomerase